MTKTILFKILKIIIPLIIFYSIGDFIIGSLSSLKDVHIDFNAYILSSSLLLLVIFYFGLSAIWFYITHINGCAIDFYKTLALWIYSNLGKYIPGKIFSYAILYHAYNKNSIAYSRLHFCLYLEQVCSLIASCLILLISLIFIDNAVLAPYRFSVIVLIAGMLLASHPTILEALVNFVMRVFKKGQVKFDVKFSVILTIIGLYMVNWFVLGFSFYFMIKSFYQISLSSYFYLTGAFSLSGLLGLLVFITPAGLGVREGVLVFLLKQILPNSIAGIIAISSRLWLIIAELACFFIAFIYHMYKKRMGTQFF